MPNATADATSHARRRPGSGVLHARVASTTASSDRNAGTASSITWLEYFTVHVWSARYSPPTGDTNASRTAVAAPNTACVVRAAVRSGSGSSLAGGEVVGRSGISGAGGSGARTRPVMIFESGGCSLR